LFLFLARKYSIVSTVSCSTANHNSTKRLSDFIFRLRFATKTKHRILKLTTLDMSKNKLKKLDPRLANLKVLKSLNVEHNKLTPGSMAVISSLPKLKSLSASHNHLGSFPKDIDEASGERAVDPSNALPLVLPKGLKTILLADNALMAIPKSILGGATPLKMLEKLDLSSNKLVSVPETIASLVGLTDLNLDDNALKRLPPSVEKLKKLKVLSLRRNQIRLANPQPLPEGLWTNTLLIDLNLHGNPMTTTQLNTMDGYDVFLSRRREVKNKDILGGAMTDLEGCGLE
jgi:Leucine-rich repeat (LRR) protein